MDALNRQRTIQFFFVFAAAMLLLKAFQLQVYKNWKEGNTITGAVYRKTVYPARGLIYDRKDKLLVVNNPAYDLMVTVDQMEKGMVEGTSWKKIKRFCDLTNTPFEEYKKALNQDFKSGRYSRSVPYVFKSKISAKEFARFQEALIEFPGFEIVLRSAREYPRPVAAHLLGYIREVNGAEVEKNKDEDKDKYIAGDYIGASGLEKQYEEQLRGKKGYAMILKDKLGRPVGKHQDGKQDIPMVPGLDLHTTIDLDLQEYAEDLLHNKRAGLVAIDPTTGGILAMVSTPNYDPNDLAVTNDKRGDVYNALLKDPNQPLFNRAIMAQYPPGSIHKTVLALSGMQMGIWDVNRGVSCNRGYFVGGAKLGCHGHPYCSNVSMGIQHSCNAYFVTVFRTLIDRYNEKTPKRGLNELNDYLDRFGYGHQLGVDYPGEKGGNFPTSDDFDTWYRKDGHWRSIWIRSLGIGQGEMLGTNLQFANLCCIIANKGFYYRPHFVDHFGENGKQTDMKYLKRIKVGVDEKHFYPVIEGMEQVTIAGTARRAFIPDIAICGKTGTAENSGKDHSIFFCFAPKKSPKIAMAVYVENAGFGGSVAAPVASLLIEKYLKGEIRTPERKFMEKSIREKDFLMYEKKVAGLAAK
jgi:penicillin-binding protein 2